MHRSVIQLKFEINMKISNLITASIPDSFSPSRATDSIPSNRDVLSFLEQLRNDGVSRNDAVKSIARAIASFKFDIRDESSLLK